VSSDQTAFADKLIRRIVDECPRRVAGSKSERHAHDLLRAEYERLGLPVEYHHFSWNISLYATIALHFGLATLGTLLFFLVHPVLALPLHLLAATSYLGDSTRRFLLLRRLFKFVPSQNLIARAPAEGTPRLRIALVAHIDAAFTGTVFHPTLIRHGTKEPPIAALGFLRKSVLIATAAVFLFAAVDLAAWLWPAGWQAAAGAILGIPPLIAFLFNAEVVLRNHVVPGANDNLTGCAGGVVLAERLKDDKPADVELVFIATGAEEAGTGGAYSLASDMSGGAWARENTVVLGIDSLSNGELRYMQDGEVVAMSIAPWLVELIEGVRATDPRFAQVRDFVIPSGATDCMPFLARGYDGVCLGCVDPSIGAPRHYHRPSDTPDNLDLEQLALSIDFVEAVVRALMART